MASPVQDSPEPGQRDSPHPASPLPTSQGSTNTNVEAAETSNDEPPLSFADLGIPTGPQLTGTVIGKTRSLTEFTKKEIVYLSITGVAILATTGFTVYKMATISRENPDFVFALVLIVNALFCSFYLLHGLRRERPYEIFILVAATVIVVVYLIVNFAVSDNKGTIKLIRLVAACLLGPVLVVMGIVIGREYLSTGKLIFRTVGASTELQTSCKLMYLFLDLIKLDLQLGITAVILVLINGVNIKTPDVAILSVGMVVLVGWFILGHLMVRMEGRIMTYIFWVLSPVEIAYLFYKFYKAVGRLESAPALSICSLIAGALAALIHVAVIIVAYFVYRNYGKGLMKKVF